MSTWADPPAEPKWMRWATYERKYERWERVVERADAVFVRQAMQTLRRSAVSIRTDQDGYSPAPSPLKPLKFVLPGYAITTLTPPRPPTPSIAAG